MRLTGTSRVSTTAPEPVVVDLVAQHAKKAQKEFAGYPDDGDGRIFAGLQVEVEASEIFIATDDVHCHLRLLSKPMYQLLSQGGACVVTSETGKRRRGKKKE